MRICLRHSRPRHQRPVTQCPQAPHTSARPKSAHPMHRQPPLQAEQILKQKPLRHAAPPPESSVHPHTREQCSRQIQHGARCCPKRYCPCSCFRFQSVYAAKCKHSEEQSRPHRHEFLLRSRSPQKAKHVHRFLHPHTQPLRAARNQILCVNAHHNRIRFNANSVRNSCAAADITGRNQLCTPGNVCIRFNQHAAAILCYG